VHWPFGWKTLKHCWTDTFFDLNAEEFDRHGHNRLVSTRTSQAMSTESPAASTPRQVTYQVKVEFGDCDPAGIVWFPNFFRWIDAASRHFFTECGVPRWEETERSLGIIGTPLVDTQARFVATASYGDRLKIHCSVTQWRGKSFVQSYRVCRGEDLILECTEVRIFAARRDDGRPGIKAVVAPPQIRALCNQSPGDN
jgi:4-hydroxybenzoyl-CoA thioesterase